MLALIRIECILNNPQECAWDIAWASLYGFKRINAPSLFAVGNQELEGTTWVINIWLCCQIAGMMNGLLKVCYCTQQPLSASLWIQLTAVHITQAVNLMCWSGTEEVGGWVFVVIRSPSLVLRHLSLLEEFLGQWETVLRYHGSAR